MEWHDFSKKLLTLAFTYRLLRIFPKRQRGLIRFNMTVSCELAALELIFALFFRNCSRIFESVLVFWFKA